MNQAPLSFMVPGKKRTYYRFYSSAGRGPGTNSGLLITEYITQKFRILLDQETKNEIITLGNSIPTFHKNLYFLSAAVYIGYSLLQKGEDLDQKNFEYFFQLLKEGLKGSSRHLKGTETAEGEIEMKLVLLRYIGYVSSCMSGELL